jgi:hypothetical protein
MSTRSLQANVRTRAKDFLAIAHSRSPTANQRGRLFLFHRAADATGKARGNSDDAVRDLQAE